MKITATLLRECALAVPLLFLAGVLVGGWWGALGVGVSGLVALANLAALWVVVDRVLRAAASGEGAGFAAGLVLAKMWVLLGVYALLLSVFPAVHVALGLALVMAGVTAIGLVEGVRRARAVEVG